MALARLLALLAVIAAFVVGGCGDDDSGGGGGGGTGTSSSSNEQPGEGKPAVTVGTKDFTEEFVLGQLYNQALEAKGYKVNYKENIGATEIIDKALTSKQIDGYPEYTGVSLSVVAGKDTVTKSAEETASLVKDFYENRGQVVSVSGRLRTVAYTPRTNLPTLEADLYDGSDTVTLVWLRRRHIAGIEPGRQVTARGRVAVRDDRKVIYNPYYELEAAK